MAKVRYEKAPDVDLIVQAVMARFADKLAHINQFRVLCVRSYGAQARAYARIWSMPQVWKTALDIDAFYVIEVLHEHFDKLS
ncbi:MAG: putative metallopeptidase, partial [Candidatus Micrarchaeia archaeon]